MPLLRSRLIIRLGVRHWTQNAHHRVSFSWRSHKCGELREKDVGQSVTLCGWLKRPRVMDKLGVSFIPVSDVSGSIQLVCNTEKWWGVLDGLSSDMVVKAVGVVRRRPSKDINKKMDTGAVEVELQSLEVLNKASHLPFSPSFYLTKVGKKLQLSERQLYLRLPKLQHNIRLRSKLAEAMRETLIKRDFVEIETPTLFKRSPEGAREFIVPTRSPGMFFSLVQSPQQFKQLLMVAGFDRYFQFARCYRDEGTRPNRQPEFTQVDLEMSFVDSDHVMKLTEQLVWSTITSICPHFTLPSPPFPRMDYSNAMEQYGSDKPDTRYEMKLHNLDNVWKEHFKQTDFLEHLSHYVHMSGLRVPKWEDCVVDLSQREREELEMRLMGSSQHVIVAMMTEDQTIRLFGKSPVDLPSSLHSVLSGAHISSHELSYQLRKALGCQPGDLCVVATSADKERDKMLTALGTWRSEVSSILSQQNKLELNPQQLNFLWVTGFPLFMIAYGENGCLALESTHHPFTAPIPQHKNVVLEESSLEQLAQVQGQHYDLVVNGVELGGGSIRVHQADLQEHILSNVLKVPTDQFSHLLKGLRSGCPPHGGIALGFDRLVAMLCQTNTLRDVIAFPKSFHGKDLLAGAPSQLSDEELASYHIASRK